MILHLCICGCTPHPGTRHELQIADGRPKLPFCLPFPFGAERAFYPAGFPLIWWMLTGRLAGRYAFRPGLYGGLVPLPPHWRPDRDMAPGELKSLLPERLSCQAPAREGEEEISFGQLLKSASAPSASSQTGRLGAAFRYLFGKRDTAG